MLMCFYSSPGSWLKRGSYWLQHLVFPLFCLKYLLTEVLTYLSEVENNTFHFPRETKKKSAIGCLQFVSAQQHLAGWHWMRCSKTCLTFLLDDPPLVPLLCQCRLSGAVASVNMAARTLKLTNVTFCHIRSVYVSTPSLSFTILFWPSQSPTPPSLPRSLPDFLPPSSLGGRFLPVSTSPRRGGVFDPSLFNSPSLLSLSLLLSVYVSFQLLALCRFATLTQK